MSTRPASRAAAGYALIAVLLFMGVIGTLSAMHLRHVMLEDRNSPANTSAQHGAAAVDAALAWGGQVLASGSGLTTATIGDGSQSAWVQLTDLGDGSTRLFAAALDSDGLGETIVVEAAHVGVAHTASIAELPRLDPVDASALLSDSAVAKHSYSGTQRVQDADLVGLVVIADGAQITFDNVVITGCLISESALHGEDLGSYSVISAPTVIVDGGLRITSSTALPGVAVLLPDGVLTSTAGPCGVQIRGDVVASAITLTGRGGITGNVATVEPLSLTGVERPGAGREPQPWAAILDTGATRALRQVAVRPRASTVDELTGITGFEFP